MDGTTKSWPRSFIEGVVFPTLVLTLGVVLAAGVTPRLVAIWDNNTPVPDVYGLTEPQARAALESAGFEFLAFQAVCSSSVAAGHVREVLVDNSAPVEDETSLVNEFTNRKDFLIDVSKDTPLVVKVGNGAACG